MYFIILLVFIIYWCQKIWISILEKLFPTIIFRTKSKKIYLTIDDVPYYRKSFKQILGVLKKHDVKATFFVIADYVNDPKLWTLLIQAVQDGHLLANHGTTNSRHAMKSYDGLSKEIITCDKLIDQIYQEANLTIAQRIGRTKLYRPGCGTFNYAMFRLAKELDFRITLGSVYPFDPQIMITDLNNYYLKQHVANGDVIILHDRPGTYKLLDKFIPWALDSGYEFSSL
jgi:peptidoglycan/xylan/chitin deacetylase (PgdA/CDA1 family)